MVNTVEAVEMTKTSKQSEFAIGNIRTVDLYPNRLNRRLLDETIQALRLKISKEIVSPIYAIHQLGPQLDAFVDVVLLASPPQ